MKKRGLITFVKNPVLGKVKTRLAASIGDNKALEVYRRLMAHTRKVAIDSDADAYLFYDQEIATNDGWEPTSFSKHVQYPGDLGERMSHAFAMVLEVADTAVIIGSDCPRISKDIIDFAFQKLQVADVVVGPTYDGGYYLLGMKKLHATLFQDIEWSSESVFDKTIEKLVSNDLLYTLMEKKSDLDYLEDLEKFPEFSEGIL